MRLVSWNCQDRFKGNQDSLLNLDSDVALVQECRPESLRKLPSGYAFRYFPSDSYKGVGLIYRSGMFTVGEEENTRVTNTACAFDMRGILDFRLVAIWPSMTTKYLRAIHNAFQMRPNWLSGSVALAGDWNCHQRWDRKVKEPRFSTLLKDLAARGIRSAYHVDSGEEHGHEKRDTHFNAGHRQPYHIDYIFLSQDLGERMKAFHLADLAAWSHCSDHAPLYVELAT